MNITVTHNAEDVGRFVEFVFARQLPFATKNALNDAAKAGQAAQRAHQHQVFTVRRKGFVDRAVKIKPFATKDRLEARVSIDPPGGESRASILTQHETERFKTPLQGARIAVPTEHVRRTGAGVIRKADRPAALRERERSGRARRGDRRGTFRRGDTIYERRRDGSIRPLYNLVAQVGLDHRLQFVTTVSRAAVAEYRVAFPRRFDQATRSAR